jgi:hypothetical protein
MEEVQFSTIRCKTGGKCAELGVNIDLSREKGGQHHFRREEREIMLSVPVPGASCRLDTWFNSTGAKINCYFCSSVTL